MASAAPGMKAEIVELPTLYATKTSSSVSLPKVILTAEPPSTPIFPPVRRSYTDYVLLFSCEGVLG
jgi:hypothetical protein